jgi:FMN-dependent NADH-azoreductase
MPQQLSHLTPKILRIDSSGRHQHSVSRTLADDLVNKLTARYPQAHVMTRDVNHNLSFVDDAWIAAAYTPEAERSPEQHQVLAFSDRLVDEFAAADLLIFSVPIYNFSIPAALKAWIDQVARIGRTFNYTSGGPHPLLPSRKTYVIVTSGGTPVGSDIDYATNYFRHVLGFLGIADVELIAADRLLSQGETQIQRARQRMDALVSEFQPVAAAA